MLLKKRKRIGVSGAKLSSRANEGGNAEKENLGKFMGIQQKQQRQAENVDILRRGLSKTVKCFGELRGNKIKIERNGGAACISLSARSLPFSTVSIPYSL
ncbi:hypothetical protein WR25_19016 [Diploscapter pachys]|uniref:Uncharacterized protein n=1 Tax=Diploscapter pachys TaxID=2018661 RepID=A0A2A2KFQ0_9BILA|nr:hypothetical protein WR25_19016 [Diploscapter pachys]